jgi:hypothetical protein
MHDAICKGIPEQLVSTYNALIETTNPDLLPQLERYVCPTGKYVLAPEVVIRLAKTLQSGVSLQGIDFQMLPLSKVNTICRALEQGIPIANYVNQSEDMLGVLIETSKLGFEPAYVISRGYNSAQIKLLLSSSLTQDEVFTLIPSSISPRCIPYFLHCKESGVDFSDILESHSVVPYSDSVLIELLLAKLGNKFNSMLLLPHLTVEQIIRLKENLT